MDLSKEHKLWLIQASCVKIVQQHQRRKTPSLFTRVRDDMISYVRVGFDGHYPIDSQQEISTEEIETIIHSITALPLETLDFMTAILRQYPLCQD